MFKAFANGGLSFEQFEGFWWATLPPYDEQNDSQRRVTSLVDQLDDEPNPERRAQAVCEIADLLR